MFGFADQLRHGSHGTVYAPGTGFKQKHGHKPQNRGCEHNAVKAKGKLGNAVGEKGAMVGPMSWNLKGPQKGYRCPQILCSGKHQPCIPKHEKKHNKEKD